MSVHLSGDRKLEEWRHTFGALSRRLADEFEVPFEQVMSPIYDACVALTHVYPEGATKPRPSHVGGTLHATIKPMTFHREVDEVSVTMEWPQDYAEYERLGTRRSLPPITGDNIPNETRRAMELHASHDFLRPMWDAEDAGIIQSVYDGTWEDVWR